MIAEVISVGTEVTIGSISNTNTSYLAQRLSEMGIEVCYHTSVDDCFERLSKVFSIAMDRSDLILVTGGLGPTEDDLTKEAAANALGLEMQSDFTMEQHLRNIFTYSNRQMTSNNLRQARKPSGSDFIPNPKGTAPGIFIKKDSKILILMPGPPREMIPMFENFVSAMIIGDSYLSIKSINTIGIGESSLEEILRKIYIAHPGFTINTYASMGSVEIKVIGKGTSKSELDTNSAAIVGLIKEKLSEYIYGYDNISIEEVILNEMESRGLSLGIAESCTGGEISRRITRKPGASKTFKLGIVTYSNQAKLKELGIVDSIIQEYGVISPETAVAMAKGILCRGEIDIAVSTTGLAGPSVVENKPVGLVYICIMDREKHIVIERIFSDDREAVQERTATLAFGQLYKFLNNPLT